MYSFTEIFLIYMLHKLYLALFHQKVRERNIFIIVKVILFYYKIFSICISAEEESYVIHVIDTWYSTIAVKSYANVT